MDRSNVEPLLSEWRLPEEILDPKSGDTHQRVSNQDYKPPTTAALSGGPPGPMDIAQRAMHQAAKGDREYPSHRPAGVRIGEHRQENDVILTSLGSGREESFKLRDNRL